MRAGSPSIFAQARVIANAIRAFLRWCSPGMESEIEFALGASASQPSFHHVPAEDSDAHRIASALPSTPNEEMKMSSRV